MRITSRFNRLAGLASAAVLLMGVAAHAQTDQPPPNLGPRVKNAQGQQAPAEQTIATYGAWKIQCQDQEQPKAADGSQPPPVKQCGMVQDGTNDKNPQARLSLVVQKTKQGEKAMTVMRVLAPIGIYLPTGVALEIDGNAAGRVPFTRCVPQLCVAFAEVSPETMAKLKKGKVANFIIYEAPGISLPMKMKLEGFDKALASLDVQ